MTLITLAEAKAYLRVDTADEDGVIIGLLSAAARLKRPDWMDSMIRCTTL